MKKWVVFLIGLLVFSSGLEAAFAKKAAVDSQKINLDKTAEYVSGWASEDTFPDAVTFAYNYAYSLAALGKPIPAETRAKIISHLTRNQQPDGGFSAGPVHNKQSNIIFTNHALQALALLNGLKSIDLEQAKKFTLELITEDGGFAATLSEGGKSGLSFTYHGLATLDITGGLSLVNKAKTTDFIMSHRKNNKGFAISQGENASPEATYRALKSLSMLGEISDPVKEGALAYLKQTRYSGLPTGKRYATVPQLKGMVFTAQALALLNALPEADTGKMYEFVESLFITQNGGFGPRPGVDTTPPSTYHAIVCLVKLGILQEPKTAMDAEQMKAVRLLFSLISAARQFKNLTFY